MAYEGQQLTHSFEASASLTTSQYKAVKMSGDDTVSVVAAVADIPCGILQNNPASGGEAVVCFMGMTKVSSDEALSRGNALGNASDGQAAVVAGAESDTVYVWGQCVKASTAANGIATAMVNFGGITLNADD